MVDLIGILLFPNYSYPLSSLFFLSSLLFILFLNLTWRRDVIGDFGGG